MNLLTYLPNVAAGHGVPLRGVDLDVSLEMLAVVLALALFAAWVIAKIVEKVDTL